MSTRTGLIVLLASAIACFSVNADASRRTNNRRSARNKVQTQRETTKIKAYGIHKQYSFKADQTKLTATVNVEAKTSTPATRAASGVANAIKAEWKAIGGDKIIKVKTSKSRVSTDWYGIREAYRRVELTFKGNSTRMATKMLDAADKIEKKARKERITNSSKVSQIDVRTSNPKQEMSPNRERELTARAVRKMIKETKQLNKDIAPAFKGGVLKGKAGRVSGMQYDVWSGYWSGQDLNVWGNISQEIE